MPAHAATTNATVDPLSNLFPLLLDMSNGLPPPPLESDWAFFVDEVALLVIVDDVLISSELVVAGTLVPRPLPADCIEVEVAAAVEVDAAAVVSAVDSRLCEVDTRFVELGL